MGENRNSLRKLKGDFKGNNSKNFAFLKCRITIIDNVRITEVHLQNIRWWKYTQQHLFEIYFLREAWEVVTAPRGPRPTDWENQLYFIIFFRSKSLHTMLLISVYSIYFLPWRYWSNKIQFYGKTSTNLDSSKKSISEKKNLTSNCLQPLTSNEVSFLKSPRVSSEGIRVLYYTTCIRKQEYLGSLNYPVCSATLLI